MQEVTQVIDFLGNAFGAKVIDCYEGPDATIMHAEILLGDSVVMCGHRRYGQFLRCGFSHGAEHRSQSSPKK